MRIETLQYSNAKLRNVSQTSNETIVSNFSSCFFSFFINMFLKVINALLDIDHLILNVIKVEHFLIKILKLTGDIQIRLIENNIEVKFKQIDINSPEIIDTKNVNIKKNDIINNVLCLLLLLLLDLIIQ